YQAHRADLKKIPLLFYVPIMGRVAAPHIPAGILGIAGLKANEASLGSGHENPAVDDGGLELDRLADFGFPKHLACFDGKAKYFTGRGSQENLVIDNGRRRQN